MFTPNVRFALTSTLLSVAAAALVSCRDVAGLEERSPVSLSVTTPRSTATASAGTLGTVSGTATTSGMSTSLRSISGNGHLLEVQFADLTIGDVRLDRRDGRDDDDSDTDGRHSGDGMFRSGPVTIALPVDGGTLTPLTGEIPFGTFDELEADLEFLRLRGAYDGQSIDVTIAIDRELALKLRPPLVIDADHPAENVTIDVDIAHCFVDASGTPIDPRRLNADATLRSVVRDCIARTLRAFEDHDRDGDDADSDSDSDRS